LVRDSSFTAEDFQIGVILTELEWFGVSTVGYVGGQPTVNTSDGGNCDLFWILYKVICMIGMDFAGGIDLYLDLFDASKIEGVEEECEKKI
jgi:hypothetical protein